VNPKNPYWVLELDAASTPGEIERQGRKILGLIELGAGKALRYECPLGTFERDATMVREAIALLRDPKRRARETCLVRLLTATDAATLRPDSEPDAPLPQAFEIGGYRGL
jgi:hypothetical protein